METAKREYVMIELLKTGGIMMIPLLLSSIVALAIVLERLYVLRRRKIIPEPVTEAIHYVKTDQDLQNLKTLCYSNQSILSQLVLECLENRDMETDALKEYMEDHGRHALRELQRGIGALEAIGSTTPLMGLLGTIFGMIRVFDTIKTMGAGQAKALSGGISEALITTAAGLIIAIPVLFAYYYLNGKIDDLVQEMEKQLLILITRVKKIEEHV